MWPYCGERADNLSQQGHDILVVPNADWDCIRGCSLGVINVIVFGVGLYALGKIGVVFYRTRWYALNFLMLFMATLQCLLTSVKYVFVKDQRLAFSAAYLRGLQTVLTSANYAKSAAESDSDPEFFSKYFAPILGMTVMYLSILYLIAVSMREFDCYHPQWMVMSISQFVIVCLFVVPGLKVMKKLTGAMNISHEYFDVMNSHQNEIAQQRRGLAVLLLVNAIGALAQLVLDSWLHSKYSGQTACAIFETAGEELWRIFLKVLSYDLPVLATVYVYYWLPRRQFDTQLDIELPVNGGFDSVDDAFSAEFLTEEDRA